MPELTIRATYPIGRLTIAALGGWGRLSGTYQVVSTWMFENAKLSRRLTATSSGNFWRYGGEAAWRLGRHVDITFLMSRVDAKLDNWLVTEFFGYPAGQQLYFTDSNGVWRPFVAELDGWHGNLGVRWRI